MGGRIVTTLRLYIAGDRAGPKFEASVARQGDRVRASARAAAQDTADTFLERGRADIRSAGNFGPRWTDGLTCKVSEGGANIRIAISEAVPYWRVFQYGATIKATNASGLLWIPLDFASDAVGIWPRDYPGGLFRVNRNGKPPLLLSSDSKEVKYFGVPQVTIPKKFHLVEIARQTAREMKTAYRARFAAAA
jgi:hypothetical protein